MDSDRQCTDGYTGLLCRNCDAERGFVKQWRKCRPCEEGETTRATILLIASSATVVLGSVFVFVRFPKESIEFLQNRNMPFKIFVGFVQVRERAREPPSCGEASQQPKLHFLRVRRLLAPFPRTSGSSSPPWLLTSLSSCRTSMSSTCSPSRRTSDACYRST